MSIRPLPDSEVRLLASSLHIVSATTLVKELLDNAIDAKATSIEVIISPNTVDQIEVRDNGTGIRADDYDSLGRRGHTSKLRRFEELNGRASKSLGFRGEALASANSVAALTITTRTSTEPVAAVLQLTSKIGGVFSQRPGSAPIGTTVSIRELYSELPVREQVAIKAAPKTLDSIKDLVRSYAAARPQLRLVLKVSKTPKFTWSYAPKADAGLQEVVLQLCGTEATSQCFKKHSTITANTDTNRAAGMSFEFDAYVPKPDADQHALPRYQYISIDSRPMTSSRGTAKKLLSIFRKFVGNAMETARKGRPAKDIFICLNIKCPQGSYDVNVEPFKDDVLFEDEAAFIGCFEQFCLGVYGPIFIPKVTDLAHQSTTLNCSNDLPTRLRRRCLDPRPAERRLPGESKPLDSIETEYSENSTESPLLDTESDQFDRSASTGGSMSRRPRSSTKTLSGWTTASALLAQDREAAHESSVSNQARNGHGGCFLVAAEWASDMAADLSEKIDEPWRKPGRSQVLPAATQRDPPKETQYGLQAIQSGSDCVARSNTSADHQANVLAGVPLNPESEVLRHFCAAPGDLGPSPLSGPNYSPKNGNMQSIVNIPARHPLANLMASSLQSGSESQRKTAPAKHHAQPPWTSSSSIQKDQGEWESRYRRPQIPTGSLRQTMISFGGPRGETRKRGSHITHEATPHNEQRDIIQYPDFEPSLGLPEPIPPSRTEHNGPPSGTAGHEQDQSRRASRSQKINENHAFSNLCSVGVEQHEGLVGDEPIRTSIRSGDPRAYLLRRQKSVVAEEGSGRPTKLRRVKSSLLHMENVPEHEETHSLLLTITVNARNVTKLIEDIERYDSYITENDIGEGLDMNGGESQRIEARLDEILSLCQQEVTGEKISVESRLIESLRNQEAGQARNG